MAKILPAMGICQMPVAPEKLRELMIASGIKSEDNVFSKGIMEMREE